MGERNHEVTRRQRLLNKEGGIAECGWSKRQLQVYDRADIKASKMRIKEWDYYLVMGQGFGVAFTISDDGYIGLQSASLLNFKENWEHTETVLNVFPMGKYHLPPSSEKGDTVYEDKRLQMKFQVKVSDDKAAALGKDDDKTGSRVRVLDCHFKKFYQGKDFECHIELSEPPMDSMVIATPWKNKKKAFYYNRKINCMRAKGYAEYDGIRYEFHPETDFGTLDWGRGVWTYDNTWYWGNGNCDIGGHSFGFNIGYGFGDTSAATENMLFYDGRAHKLDDITFEIPLDDKGREEYLKPWRFTSSDGRFEMDFVPVLDRAAHISACIIESDQHQVFGKMSGKATLDDGTVIEIKDCMCFAEKVHNRY
ncbi:MAG: DUF2804 domain-containing protein [Lachnospiraceae bacterium]|nr:DUF2804 domain-containing protein [Lachnospiraceae bacterium]